MKDIYTSNLKDLAPKSKLRSKEDLLFYDIVNETIKKYITNEIQNLVILDNIDNLKENIIDLLAYELHVDFYDYSALLTEKKHLVKTSILSHMKKGTVYSVQNILNTFFQESTVKEWFEYGGNPGMFNVEITDSNADYSQANKIKRMIDSVKRTSQHLDNLTFIKGDSSELFYFSFIHDSGRKKDLYNPI